MILINLIKVGVIRLCDFVNELYSPFEKATYTGTANLDTLEKQFYTHLQSKFVENGHFKYQLPMPDDHGDAALFQGLYTGLMNLAKSRNDEAVIAANTALDSYFHNAVLVRGVRADGTINDTTSNDSATGVLFGLYWRWCNTEQDETLTAWALNLMESNYALTDLNGKPTKFGRLEQGWKTDPLRLTLLLAILALAGKSSNNGVGYRASVAYNKLYRKYKLLLKYPKIKLLWWDTDYDTHRAAIHLNILFNLTGEKVYLDGLKRIYRITKKENNAWVNLLCFEADTSILNSFVFENRIKGNVESWNSPYFPGVQWGKHRRSIKALPIAHRGSQEFFWQRNMFSLDEWMDNKEATVFHSGLDFLLAYWLKKNTGVIK